MRVESPRVGSSSTLWETPVRPSILEADQTRADDRTWTDQGPARSSSNSTRQPSLLARRTVRRNGITGPSIGPPVAPVNG